MGLHNTTSGLHPNSQRQVPEQTAVPWLLGYCHIVLIKGHERPHSCVQLPCGVLLSHEKEGVSNTGHGVLGDVHLGKQPGAGVETAGFCPKHALEGQERGAGLSQEPCGGSSCGSTRTGGQEFTEQHEQGQHLPIHLWVTAALLKDARRPGEPRSGGQGCRPESESPYPEHRCRMRGQAPSPLSQPPLWSWGVDRAPVGCQAGESPGAEGVGRRRGPRDARTGGSPT